MAILVWSGAARSGDRNDPVNRGIGGQPAGRIPWIGDDVDMGGAPHLPFPILSGNATINSLVVNETTTIAAGATHHVAGALRASKCGHGKANPSLGLSLARDFWSIR